MNLDSLYIAYWSLLDPLCQSQALPVVQALAARGWRMGLMTFEQPPWRLDRDARARESLRLRAERIHWFPMWYHKRPPILSTAADIGRGALRCRMLGRRGQVRMLHGRGSVAMAIAYVATRFTGGLLLGDLDGPLSEEYVDAGHWRRSSLAYRATRWVETRALRAADARIVLTARRWQTLEHAVRPASWVVPCAVDTELFRPEPDIGRAHRVRLGLKGTVLVYAGKAGGWYLTDHMWDWVASASRVLGEVSVLVLTTDRPEAFSIPAGERAIRCVVRSASRKEMPGFLCAADAALSFVLPAPSKTACSPVKNAEYLACGLPVVSTRDIGDYSELIAARQVGVVVPGLDEASYRSSAVALSRLLEDPGLRVRCRAVAEQELSLAGVAVPRYREAYRRLLGQPRGE